MTEAEKKEIVSTITDVLESSQFYEDTNKRIFKSISDRLPWWDKIQGEITKENKANALPQIKQLCDELDSIFQPINIEVCSKCPRHARTENPSPDSLGCNMGCCRGCWEYHGYFKRNYGTLTEFRKELGELKDQYKWNHISGFHSSGGCRLPREKRSITCLNERCGDFNSKLSNDQLTRVNVITEKIKKLRNMIKSVLY